MSPESELDEMTNKRVLDPCSGGRSMWFDRNHPDVVFGDVRSETLTVTDNSRGNPTGQRTLRIEPDVMLDFRDLPYADATFRLVAFDPPHLVHRSEEHTSELQSLMRISYAVFCLKKKTKKN